MYWQLLWVLTWKCAVFHMHLRKMCAPLLVGRASFRSSPITVFQVLRFLADLPSRCSSYCSWCPLESTAIFMQVSVAVFTPIQVNFVYLGAVFFGVCRLKIVLFYHELTLWSINNVLIKMFDWKFLLSDISLVMPMLLIAICMAYLFFSLLLFSFYVCVSYKMPLVNSISLDNFFPTCHPLLVGDLNPFVQCYWWRSPYLCHFAFIFSTSSRFCLPQFLHYRFFGLIDFSSAPSNSIPISCPVYSLVTFLVVTMGIK